MRSHAHAELTWLTKLTPMCCSFGAWLPNLKMHCKHEDGGGCLQGDNKGFLVCKKKMATSADLLCRYTPPAFRQFTEAVVNLKFDEEPRYSAYVPLFEPLCGPGPQRPILLEEKSRVGQKRGREAFEGEDMEIVSLVSCSVTSCLSPVPQPTSLLCCACNAVKMRRVYSDVQCSHSQCTARLGQGPACHCSAHQALLRFSSSKAFCAASD